MVGMVGKEAVGPLNFFAIMFNFLPLSSLSRVSVYKYHVKSEEFRSCTKFERCFKFASRSRIQSLSMITIVSKYARNIIKIVSLL